jgi:hypothetical protein
MLRWLAGLLVWLLVASAGAAPGRDPAERAAFVRGNPCPATHARRGACPGWQVDHTIPLCAGGPDHRSNMAWLSLADHKFKTFIDVRECRKLSRMARTPARER